MTKKKPNIDKIVEGQWIELPSGAIVSIRRISVVTTIEEVVEVRTLDQNGAMANGSFNLNMEYLRNKGKLLPSGMVSK